jgi:hypothetical protein
MQSIKTVFLGIISNIITPLIISLGGVAAGLFTSFSYEIRIAVLNAALSLSIIILILNLRFSPLSPQAVRVIKTEITAHTYLVQNNVARHIPDGETFEYLGKLYGFHWGSIETIRHDEFKRQFTTESTLPSILT